MDLRRALDKASGIPVYIQLEERVRLLIHEGVLAVGDAMPTAGTRSASRNFAVFARSATRRWMLASGQDR